MEAEFATELTNDDGSPTKIAYLLDYLNLLFTVLFTVELAINALAHWFRPFITDVWSQLDAFVVAMSIVPLLVPNQNTGIVRILRAFRILRLFRRVPSLRKIITALSMAVLPVLNVFCILFLLMGICEFFCEPADAWAAHSPADACSAPAVAVVAVSLFGDVGERFQVVRPPTRRALMAWGAQLSVEPIPAHPSLVMCGHRLD